MSDSSSDTSVGSSPYQSDQEVMPYGMVGEDTNIEKKLGNQGVKLQLYVASDISDVPHDAGDTCARHSNDSNTVGLEEQDNNASLDGAGCSTETLQASLVRLEEENIQLKKRIEELEHFDRLSLASGDSGFHSETSSLASWGRGPTTHRRQQDKVGHVGKIEDNLKRLFNPRLPNQKVTQNQQHADTDLYLACKKGDMDLLRRILSKCLVDVDSRLKYGRTPVMIAAEMGHRQVFDLLVGEGADVSLVDADRNNILHVASLGGHVDIVRYFLSQKVADINSMGKYGRTPVMVAAEKGHRQVFNLLVTQGADVSVVDDDRNNILHVASLGGHVDIVRYFLSRKVADINSMGKYGRTPVMNAAEMGHRQVFDLLVTQGADVSVVDDDRNNILHVACLGGHVDIVKYVLSQKVADINSRGKYGRTPVMVAAEKGHSQVFDLLVTQGADVSLVDDKGNNILFVACLGGHVDIVKYVLSQKVADINSRGKYGRTPVMVAAEKGHSQVFDLLVTQGADVSAMDDDGNNILHVACLGGHVDVVKYVLSQKVADINSRGQYGRTPLMVAVGAGHGQVFDLLVTQGADVSLVDDKGNNILFVACLGGHVDIVKYVLSQKVADINSRGKYGRTPVMVAAEKGHSQVFDLLVTQGADVSLVDNDGNNILHVACLGGHVDVVKYVLSQQVADINSRGKYGRTPLMVAAVIGHRQVFDLLVTQGADVSLVDDKGNNILFVACLGGHVDIVMYVLSQKVADINSRGQYGRTPLMKTAWAGHRQVFDLLVGEGADVSLVDNHGDNILHVACLGGHVDMVKYVLSQQVADINSRGKYGRTPLMVAAEKGHRQMFDLLVREGADVLLVDDNRNNILHVASLGGDADMVKHVQALNVVNIDDRNDHDDTVFDHMVATQGSSYV